MAHPTPKIFRLQKSTGKILASVFCDQDGILLIDYLPKGQTINAEYYASLLVQLMDILMEKRRGKVTKDVMFLQDKRAISTQKKVAYLGFQCVDHPSYSPDLAPSDYHLFPGLKKTIESSLFFVRRGGHCCRGDLVGRTNFRVQTSDFFFFLGGVQKLEQRAKKCIELRGEYIEYIPRLVAVACFLLDRTEDL